MFSSETTVAATEASEHTAEGMLPEPIIEPLTPQILDHLRALLVCASPARWWSQSSESDGEGKHVSYGLFYDATPIERQTEFSKAEEAWIDEPEDWALAAALRNNAPALLDAAERLPQVEAERDLLEEERDAACQLSQAHAEYGEIAARQIAGLEAERDRLQDALIHALNSAEFAVAATIAGDERFSAVARAAYEAHKARKGATA